MVAEAMVVMVTEASIALVMEAAMEGMTVVAIIPVVKAVLARWRWWWLQWSGDGIGDTGHASGEDDWGVVMVEVTTEMTVITIAVTMVIPT